MQDSKQRIIRISTIDEKGLIYRISSVLYKLGLNIERNDEYVDKETRHFFMRTHVRGLVCDKTLYRQIKSVLPSQSMLKITDLSKKNIIIFCTKENHCIGDLLLRHDSGELNARMHESEILKILSHFSFSYIVLAKYMRILSKNFIQHFSHNIINIHHSFLPAFIGANPYKQAYKRGVKIIGATAHFVNEQLDEGPIIMQDVIHINHSYSWQDMQKAGRDIEKNVLSCALGLALEDRIFVYGNRTIVF